MGFSFKNIFTIAVYPEIFFLLFEETGTEMQIWFFIECKWL